MYSPGHFVTVQGHPEFTGDIVTEIVGLRTEAGIFSKEQSTDALGRAKNQHDGVAIGAVFLKFLLQGVE